MPKNLRDRILFFSGSSGFLSGVFLFNVFHDRILFLFLLLVIVVVQIGVLYGHNKRVMGFFLVFFAIGALLGFETREDTNKYERILEEKTAFFTREVSVIGVLREKFSENERGVRYVLRDISIDGQLLPEKMGIIATFATSHWIGPDMIISFTGMVRRPVSNADFDYKTYLLLDNIYATASVSRSEQVGMHTSSVFTLFIRRIRDALLGTIGNIYPGESAKLLSWILLGERADIAPETKNAFNASGLTHIVAVSGFNITIILIFLSFLFRSFPVLVRVALALLFVGIFTLLVGSQISVLRASVFGLISYTILLSGKRIRAFAVLIAVAIIFVALNPLVLNYDVSFHLSFLAVFGLIFFGDFFLRIFRWFPSWFWLREALAMCFAAMVFTLPITMVNFGQISIVAPIANLAVVPIIPLVMLFGFLSMLADLFSHSIGILLGFPTWLWLDYILEAVGYFGGLKYAVLPIDLGNFAHIFEILYFIVMGFLVVWFQKKEE